MKEKLSIILSFVLIVLAYFALKLLIYGIIMVILVWTLNACDVYTIGSFVVTFNWKLVIIIALINTLLAICSNDHCD